MKHQFVVLGQIFERSSNIERSVVGALVAVADPPGNGGFTRVIGEYHRNSNNEGTSNADNGGL